METQHSNISQKEIRKFETHVSDWWDRNGSMKSLHDINPLRLSYIKQRVMLTGKIVLDVGCGAGILTESLAKEGAIVTGIDASQQVIAAARAHERLTKSGALYQVTTAEKMARAKNSTWDTILCLELLEHIPNPISVINACKILLKPGGEIIFATINRNFAAYMLAILMAENVLKLLTPGTHTYHKLIKPSELTSMGRSQGLSFSHIQGFSYNPITRKYYLCKNTMVNYMIHLKKEPERTFEE